MYARDMRARFSDTEYIDPMSELVSLKQSKSVEEYYDEFEALLNLLQLSDEYSLSVFVSNLKLEISKSVRLFHPKTLNHALNLAKQMEALLYNVPRKNFVPYRPTMPQTTTYPYASQNKQYTLLNTSQLPSLLPTPK